MGHRLVTIASRPARGRRCVPAEREPRPGRLAAAWLVLARCRPPWSRS